MWLVSGITGAYSDQQSWNVKLFKTEEGAQSYCDKLNEWCKDNVLSYSRYKLNYNHRIPNCPLDKNFSCDYLTGTKYFLEKVEVGDVL